MPEVKKALLVQVIAHTEKRFFWRKIISKLHEIWTFVVLLRHKQFLTWRGLTIPLLTALMFDLHRLNLAALSKTFQPGFVELLLWMIWLTCPSFCFLQLSYKGPGSPYGVHLFVLLFNVPVNKWAPSSEFVSSNIPSWQILTAHAQPFRGARDLAFCLKIPLDSLLIWTAAEVLARLRGCAGSPEPSLLA